MVLSGFENRRARIEILPLIDVVFLLLVFFIYAMMAMVTHRGLKVNLPQASTSSVNKEDFLTVSINKENEIFVNKKPVSLNEIPQYMQTQKPVYIQADQQADVGVAVSILDEMNKAGIKDISFETKAQR